MSIAMFLGAFTGVLLADVVKRLLFNRGKSPVKEVPRGTTEPKFTKSPYENVSYLGDDYNRPKPENLNYLGEGYQPRKTDTTVENKPQPPGDE